MQRQKTKAKGTAQLHAYPDIFTSPIKKLHRLEESSIQSIINQIPDDWMTQSAKRFALALMLYNLDKIKRLIQ